MDKSSFQVRAIIMALALLGAFSLPELGLGQENKDGADSASAGGKLLAKKSHGGQRSLLLWQLAPKPAPPLDGARLSELLRNPEPLNIVDISSFNHPAGDVVFALVDSPGADGHAGNLVGTVYAIKDVSLPYATWSGDLVPGKAGGDAYVVLVRSKFLAITLAVYRVSPERKVADFPYKFDLQESSKWPKPLSQLSELKTEIAAQCGVNKIEAEIEGRVLVIRAGRVGESCAPTTFRFDTATNKWLAP